jgi:16S rRNA (uracil1498-N3)-methyltransferase
VDLDQGRVWLHPDETRHVAKVLRHHAGDAIEVIDGSGRRFAVELLPTPALAARESGLAGRIFAVHPAAPEPPPLVLAVPMIRWPRLEELVGGAVQLGTTHVALWSAANASFNEPLTPGRRDRLQHILRAATTQSLGLRLPALSGPHALAALIDLVRGHATWVAHGPLPPATSSPANTRAETGTRGGRALVIGPEGGLRDAEVEALTAAGASILDLGPRRLRTEVAAIAGLAILLGPGPRPE